MRAAIIIACIAGSLVGCLASDPEPSQRGRDAIECVDPLSYAQCIAPIMEARCLACHSASATPSERLGAPIGVDFDTEADLQRWRETIHDRAVALGNMPPTGPIPDTERASLEAYLAWLSTIPCSPSCTGRTCDDDGCGGSCGTCEAGSFCANGQCEVGTCTPDCTGRACGDDGCGGACGECELGFACAPTGTCACAPDCGLRVCGDDGCGASCGSCGTDERCVDGGCDCVPRCDGRECGDDGCGGSCGQCSAPDTCTGNTCACVADCQNRRCGGDGCGGSCGNCPGMLTCDTRNGTCVASCTPDCSGRVCGDDGCGGSCGGPCPSGTTCDATGQCACAPSCVGRQCGDDGCGGSCGACPGGSACNGSGTCQCTPNCAGRQCGDDGCGGTCGTCPTGTACGAGGSCQCIPNCTGLQCGSDGCNGTCGACPSNSACNSGQCVWPATSFSADVMPIFVATGCGTSSCHGGARPKADLDLRSPAVAYVELVGVPSTQCANLSLVAPGAPQSSYLVNKLTGVGMCTGSLMPKGGGALSSSQIDVVRAWIGSGAANN